MVTACCFFTAIHPQYHGRCLLLLLQWGVLPDQRVRMHTAGRVSKKSKATVAGIKSSGTRWCSGEAHGAIPWNWWEATIATWLTHGSSSIRGGSTPRVCFFFFFSRLPVSLKLLSLPRRALATTIMAAMATRRRIKIVTRMFNVQLELQRFDLDEARPKTRL